MVLCVIEFSAKQISLSPLDQVLQIMSTYSERSKSGRSKSGERQNSQNTDATLDIVVRNQERRVQTLNWTFYNNSC